MNRIPWMPLSKNNMDETDDQTRLGDVISADQLKSPMPGLIAQMTGFVNTKKYQYATVYVDQVLRLSYVYPLEMASAEENMEGKDAWERYARERGVTIKSYHADIRIF